MNPIMKKFRVVLGAALVALLAAGPVPASGDIRPADIRLPTQKRVLDNGLTVLIGEMPSNPLVAIYALVKTGSTTEGKYLGAGISHFMEHMLFKGTARRAPGVIPAEIQALGGYINATTGFDYTYYVVNVPYEQLDGALDVLADMLMHARFDPEDIATEREVVYSEIRLYKDRPDRYHSQLVFDTVYRRHPYRLPVIGHEELLRQLTRDDFVAYYRERYVPNNMILAVAGGIRADEVLPKIEAAFKDFSRQSDVPRNLPQEPQQIIPRYFEKEYPTQLTRMSLAYRGVNLLNDDMFALDVLAMALGQGASSRLYQDLFKKKKLVRSISAFNYTPMDPGAFEIEALLDKDKIEETIAAVKAQIARIGRHGLTRAELAKCKRQVRSGYLHELQTASGVAYNMAVNEAVAGDYTFSEKYIRGIDAVSVEDIRRVTRRYLCDNRLSIVVLKPVEPAPERQPPPQDKVVPDVEKVVLDNGLTILLREDHTLPLVAMTLTLQGGTRWEDDEFGGIARLTANLWSRGTGSRSAEAIAESVESRGAGLGGFSGRNSLGLKMNVMAEDIEFGIDLLADLIRHPSFDERELVRAKDEIKTAIMARDDQIAALTGKALRETLFVTHPFRKDELGTLESVERISREDIVGFYGRLAVAGNMVLSVFGDFSSRELVPLLRDRLSKIKAGEIPEQVFSEPPPEATREKTLLLDKKQAMVMVGFQGAGIRSEDRFGIEVLTTVLGSSFNGRMFKKIREEFGKAYSLGGSFTPSLDTGMIYFYVLTEENSVAKVKDMLEALIREIQQEGITDQELRDTKAYMKGAFARGIETNAALGFMSALNELYGLGFAFYREEPRLIDQVTREDVRRLACEYLDWDRAVVVLARPKGRE